MTIDSVRENFKVLCVQTSKLMKRAFAYDHTHIQYSSDPKEQLRLRQCKSTRYLVCALVAGAIFTGALSDTIVHLNHINCLMTTYFGLGALYSLKESMLHTLARNKEKKEKNIKEETDQTQASFFGVLTEWKEEIIHDVKKLVARRTTHFLGNDNL